jgi:hypothetical protein
VRYWWVNQSKTHEQEQKGGYLWSPKANRNGAYNQFYENMKHVTPGDLVFCYWDGLLQACGIVASPYSEAPRPKEFGDAGKAWADDGYQVDVSFRPIDPPVSPKVHWELIRPVLPENYSPLNRSSGAGLQNVYLAELPDSLGQLLLSLVANRDDIVSAAAAQAEAAVAPEVAAAIAAVDNAAGRPGSGQGFGLSPAARKAVEDRAMQVATKHYEEEGWHVVDVSKKRSYDLVCQRDGQELRVEVKGTTGLGEKILLPRNEVSHAREHYPKVVLFVVHGITLSKATPPEATGGMVRLVYPWDVNQGQLEALAFSYVLPKPQAG